MVPCVFSRKSDHCSAIKFTVHLGWSIFSVCNLVFFHSKLFIGVLVQNLIKVQYKKKEYTSEEEDVMQC